MTVKRSTDFAYFREVLTRPGMLRAVGGMAPDALDVDEALAHPNTVFFDVSDGDRRLGFIAFRKLSADIAEIHTALLTLGSRSLAAIRNALDQIARDGVCCVIAAYPPTHRAVDRVATQLGFQTSARAASLYAEPTRASHLIKELSLCLS